jgi:protein phosphatase 1G
VAVVQGKTLYVANAGDSRCVLCRGLTTKALTTDHKPTNPDEERRIIDAGGFVTEGRVNGCLNLSRAIGDMNYKQVLMLHESEGIGMSLMILWFLTNLQTLTLESVPCRLKANRQSSRL